MRFIRRQRSWEQPPSHWHLGPSGHFGRGCLHPIVIASLVSGSRHEANRLGLATCSLAPKSLRAHTLPGACFCGYASQIRLLVRLDFRNRWTSRPRIGISTLHCTLPSGWLVLRLVRSMSRKTVDASSLFKYCLTAHALASQPSSALCLLDGWSSV